MSIYIYVCVYLKTCPPKLKVPKGGWKEAPIPTMWLLYDCHGWQEYLSVKLLFCLSYLTSLNGTTRKPKKHLPIKTKVGSVSKHNQNHCRKKWRNMLLVPQMTVNMGSLLYSRILPQKNPSDVLFRSLKLPAKSKACKNCSDTSWICIFFSSVFPTAKVPKNELGSKKPTGLAFQTLRLYSSI